MSNVLEINNVSKIFPNKTEALKDFCLEIKEGEIFNENNITVKRPGTGLSPMLWDKVIGKASSKDFYPDELIEI